MKNKLFKNLNLPAVPVAAIADDGGATLPPFVEDKITINFNSSKGTEKKILPCKRYYIEIATEEQANMYFTLISSILSSATQETLIHPNCSVIDSEGTTININSPSLYFGACIHLNDKIMGLGEVYQWMFSWGNGEDAETLTIQNLNNPVGTPLVIDATVLE